MAHVSRPKCYRREAWAYYTNFKLNEMTKYLLAKLDKTELIDIVIDLLEVKALLEYDVDLYRDWYKKEQSQENYIKALLREQQSKNKALESALNSIVDSINQEDDVTSDETIIEEVVDTLTPVFKLDKKAQFTTEFTEEYMELGKKFIKEHEDGSEEREALRAKLKGTYSYQDEKRRERFRKNNY